MTEIEALKAAAQHEKNSMIAMDKLNEEKRIEEVNRIKAFEENKRMIDTARFKAASDLSKEKAKAVLDNTKGGEMTETMIVNGFEVPAGIDLTKLPSDFNWDNYWIPCPTDNYLVSGMTYHESENEFGFLQKFRLMYTNKDDALKRALAMLGINPKNYSTFRDGYKEKFNEKPVFKDSRNRFGESYDGRFCVDIIE